MFYTPKYVNPGDIVTANDLNAIENQLARLYNFRGLISTSQNLPDSADAGDFYFLTVDNAIQVYDGTQWIIHSMPSSIEWNDILDKPGVWEQNPLFWLPRNTILYYANSITDLWTGTQPNGTDISGTAYGFYKDTTGLLAVTLRKDETPFEEARGFAVEEATENLVDASGYVNSSDQIPVLGLASIVYHGHISSATDHDNVYNKTDYNISIAANESVTYSGWFYIDDDYGRVMIYQNDTCVGDWNNLSEGWHYLTTTWINDTGSDVTISTIRVEGGLASDWANGKIELYLGNFQAEKKTFATSFVDGSRPDGGFQTLYDGGVRLLQNSGSVFSAWFKIPHYDAAKKYRLFTTGEFYVGKDENGNWRLGINDGGTFKTQDLLDQDILTDGNWHFVVLGYYANEKEAKVYIDGVLQASISLTDGLQYASEKHYALSVGCDIDPTQDPPLTIFTQDVYFASLLISNPYDTLFNIIWGDELIQKLANWKHKFIVYPYNDKYIDALQIILGSSVSESVETAVFDESLFGRSAFGG